MRFPEGRPRSEWKKGFLALRIAHYTPMLWFFSPRYSVKTDIAQQPLFGDLNALNAGVQIGHKRTVGIIRASSGGQTKNQPTQESVQQFFSFQFSSSYFWFLLGSIEMITDLKFRYICLHETYRFLHEKIIN